MGKRKVRALPPIAILLLALAGCGGGAGASSEPSPGSEVAPGVPTSRGGDNSIQTYGREASARERFLLSTVVHAYLDARAAEQWRDVCNLLTEALRNEYEEVSRSRDCAQIMRAFTAPTPRVNLELESQIMVLSARIAGAQAFLIYRQRHSGEGVYAMPLALERGKWKVGLVTPVTLE